jgi:hypothetical protein
LGSSDGSVSKREWISSRRPGGFFFSPPGSVYFSTGCDLFPTHAGRPPAMSFLHGRHGPGNIDAVDSEERNAYEIAFKPPGDCRRARRRSKRSGRARAVRRQTVPTPVR